MAVLSVVQLKMAQCVGGLKQHRPLRSILPQITDGSQTGLARPYLDVLYENLLF